MQNKIIEELKQLREQLFRHQDKEVEDESVDCSYKEYDLNLKVDNFNKWCYKYKIKGRYTEIGEYQNQNLYKDFIEKMAIWYELRYPDYEVSKLFGESINKNINEEMYNNNPYIRTLFANSNRLLFTDWKEFYNFEVFKNSLSPREQSYLETPEYKHIVEFYNDYSVGAHLYLSPDGFVTSQEFLHKYVKNKFNPDILVGMHIKDVLKFFKDKEITDAQNLMGIKNVIKEYEEDCYFKEELLNCVMYRIIERGSNRTGSRRAFIFAKEFERNIDIPMMYGIDTSDPYLYMLIIEYLKAGGTRYLVCCDDYFSRTSKTDKIKKINLKKVIALELNNLKSKNKEDDIELLLPLLKSDKQKQLSR